MSTPVSLAIDWRIVLALAVSTPIALIPQASRRIIFNVISAFLNFWLTRQHDVKHVEKKSQLPGCEYAWPNGQGDAAKFLYGKENSENWEKEHGPIYRIWSGMTPEVVLTRPEDIQAVFKDSDKHIKAVNNNSGYLLSEILGRCVGLISGEDWKNLRNIVAAPFSRTTTAQYVSIVERRTARHLSEIENLKNGIIDPALDLKMLPFWVVAEVIYGELNDDLEADLKRLAPQREAFFKHVIAGGLGRFHWSKWLPTQANRELKAVKENWSAFNLKARDRALADGIDAPIVEYYAAVEAGSITEEQLLHTLDEMLYANLDVTLGGISWNLVFLGANPHVQNRLLEEVREVRAAVEDKPSAVDDYLLSSSSYVQACINESSRLRPLAAFSVPQAAPTPRVIGGYLFPAGTNFIIDSYALNQRNEYWGADTAVYRPERFSERSATQARYNYWRFGFGPRQCIGKYVADLSIRTLLAQLVEGWELGMIKTDGEWQRDMEIWINHPQMTLKCVKRA